MAIAETIWDWPASIVPRSQLLRVPGQAIQGGFTSGGARLYSPDVGGRAIMKWEFNVQDPETGGPRLFSWLLSKLGNGSIFKLRMLAGLQVVSGADLGLVTPASYANVGLPWEGDLLWSNGLGWDFDPGVTTVGTALDGAVSLTVDFGALLPVLLHGHAIGIAGRAYIVDDIEYDGAIATITVTPPLRTATADGDWVSFRPHMYGVCVNASDFEALFEHGRWVRPGNVIFSEVIL